MELIQMVIDGVGKLVGMQNELIDDLVPAATM